MLENFFFFKMTHMLLEQRHFDLFKHNMPSELTTEGIERLTVWFG